MPHREQFTTPLEIDIDLMNDKIKCLMFRIDQETAEHEKRLRQLRLTRLSLQTICTHEFAAEGHTHGGTFETCQICGYNQKQ